MFIFNQSNYALVFNVLMLFSLPSHAEHLHEAIKTEESTQNAAIQSQKKINGLSDKTRRMLAQYRATTHQTETLITYNKHLQTLLTSQETEKASLQQQLQEIEVTQREIVPLIIRMADSLEKFITLDLPFLPEERKQRLDKIKAMMSQADVTTAEKFRRIIEAYEIENNYGNTIEAYRANLVFNGVTSSVDFLRLGRVALYFQRFDGSETGYWDRKQNQWHLLLGDQAQAIRQGIRIARKEKAPNMLTLPIPAAESVQ